MRLDFRVSLGLSLRLRSRRLYRLCVDRQAERIQIPVGLILGGRRLVLRRLQLRRFHLVGHLVGGLRGFRRLQRLLWRDDDVLGLDAFHPGRHVPFVFGLDHHFVGKGLRRLVRRFGWFRLQRLIIDLGRRFGERVGERF